MIFFFNFPVLSGNFGKQSLKVPYNKNLTLIFGITVFLSQNKIPVDHMIDRKQFLYFKKNGKLHKSFLDTVCGTCQNVTCDVWSQILEYESGNFGVESYTTVTRGRVFVSLPLWVTYYNPGGTLPPGCSECDGSFTTLTLVKS